MIDFDNNRIVTTRKIHKALNENPSGVQRLAKFVGASSYYPDVIYEACELNRQWLYQSQNTSFSSKVALIVR